MDIKISTFDYWIKIYIYNNDVILPIVRKSKNRIIRYSLLLILFPFFLFRWCICVFIESVYATQHILKLQEKEKSNSFKHQFGIVCISKNEGLYLREWVEYHILKGCDIFYFYDNESNDKTKDILKSYIDSGLVVYKYIKGKGKQLNAYNDAIKKYKYECKYMAFIDMDEYLYTTNGDEKMIEVIEKIINRAGDGAVGVGANWSIFGSSNYVKRPQGLITSSYIYRSNNGFFANRHIKTICNPRMVYKYISPHYPMYRLGAFSVSSDGKKRLWGWFNRDVNWENLRINHYYCKSREDYLYKTGRGLGDRIGDYDTHIFDILDKNDVKDEGMLLYKGKLDNVLLFYENN